MPEFTGKTGTPLRIQLPSAILVCEWGQKSIQIGAAVSIEVKTVYVSDNSPIRITVRDMGGRTVDTLEGVVYSNHYRARYLISPGTPGALTFSAEMKDHGLRAGSGRLEILPPAA